MDRPREAVLALVAVVGGGLVLLVAEPVFGLTVLAGSGAASLMGATGRRVAAGLVLLVGLAVAAVGLDRGNPWLVLAGALVAAGASLAVVRSHRWRRPRRAPAETTSRERTSRDTWDALDRGEDPTA